MTRPPISPPRASMLKLVAVLLAMFALPLLAAGQAVQSQTSAAPQPQPVSLPHLYWHFLIHQSDLDSLAAKLSSGTADGVEQPGVNCGGMVSGKSMPS